MNDVIYHEKILVTVERTDGKNNDLRMKPFFPLLQNIFLVQTDWSFYNSSFTCHFE